MVLNERAIGTLGTSGGAREREMDSIGATQANFLPRSSLPPSLLLAKRRRGRGPAGLHARPMRWNQTTVVSPMAEVATTDGKGEGGRATYLRPTGGGGDGRRAPSLVLVQGSCQSKQMACALCGGAARPASASTLHSTGPPHARVILLFKFLLSFWYRNKVT